MKSIFVPIGGGDSDASVMHAALAFAAPLQAHIDFMHIHVTPAEASRYTPHIEFARGPAIRSAMAELECDAATRSKQARRHVLDFCTKSSITMKERPDRSPGTTAHWHEEHGDALRRLVFHARHHDLTVVARYRGPDGLPPDRLEKLLLEAGRPLILAPTTMRLPLLDHVVVCWKESADAARALTAAMPILRCANQVHIVAVGENNEHHLAEGLAALVRQLRWSQIDVDYSFLTASNHESTDSALLRSARERDAGLIVMGGYGHSHARQFVFGGCTRSMLENTDLDIAVFMAH